MKIGLLAATLCLTIPITCNHPEPLTHEALAHLLQEYQTRNTPQTTHLAGAALMGAGATLIATASSSKRPLRTAVLGGVCLAVGNVLRTNPEAAQRLARECVEYVDEHTASLRSSVRTSGKQVWETATNFLEKSCDTVCDYVAQIKLKRLYAH
jgi:hypothetical protein